MRNKAFKSNFQGMENDREICLKYKRKLYED